MTEDEHRAVENKLFSDTEFKVIGALLLILIVSLLAVVFWTPPGKL